MTSYFLLIDIVTLISVVLITHLFLSTIFIVVSLRCWLRLLFMKEKCIILSIFIIIEIIIDFLVEFSFNLLIMS